jgi:hypothetical protein
MQLAIMTTPTPTARNLVGKAFHDHAAAPCMSHGALHATMASGGGRLATDGGSKIAR